MSNNVIVKLLHMENRLDILYTDSVFRGCEMTQNSPYNNRAIRLHKGVDNQIRFRVLNPDRKRVSIDHLSIRARFINKQNGERVLDRFANILTTKGDVQLIIYEGDLVNLAPGYYDLVVTGEEALVPGVTVGENISTPFFLDQDGDIVATVEVVASADPTPQPTVTLLPDNWTRWSSNAGVDIQYYSSAIPGQRIKNHLNALHTFAAYTTAFSGTLEVRASLDLQPPENYNDYFPVDITSGTQIITFDNYTGVTSHSFEANFMWLMFVYTPDTSLDDYGTIDQLLVR